MKTEALATRAATQSCFGSVTAKPEFASLKTKMYLGDEMTQVPLGYLTNSSRPTKKELAEVLAIHGEFQACRKEMLEGQSKIHPLIVTAQVEGFTASDRVWAEFVEGKQSWGQFNTKRRDVAMQVRASMVEAGGRIDAQLNDAHRYEIAQRQRAAEAISQWAAQQQAINAMNRPRTTNCTGFGNSINCTTY